MNDDFVSTHPTPPGVPVVEERTPYQRMDRITADLEQLAKEYDESPIATWCLRAAEALVEGKTRAAAWEASKAARG